MSMQETIIETEKLLKLKYPTLEILIFEEDGENVVLDIKKDGKGSRVSLPTAEMYPDILASIIEYQILQTIEKEENEKNEESI